MKKQIIEKIEIPQGIECSFENNILECKKDSLHSKRKIDFPGIIAKIENNNLILSSKGNKISFKIIKALSAHIKNIFLGLEKKYQYELEACNVHFPMTLKVEKGKLIINNFLGEKTPRTAEILPNVSVEVKGQKITVSSHDKESAGQVAANFEKATKIKSRDRRVFQDGIFLISKGEKK